ncbi:hypothetical protein LCGC14_1669200, partial [marine sediment metagenome]
MAVAHCHYCSWTWSWIPPGLDTVVEEAHFLRSLLIDHVEQEHPGKRHDRDFTGMPVLPRRPEENAGG